ncbi:hypothetical protein IGS68_27825 (plasmid) [Skermanella sp. TT6]|uniref:DUF1468 domain-containing protein n=1 Tax=Skermanella cutis TaxID=2775420 RepID=A0ABX7BI73_9PROT|nr:hypothetical protein [Skermanella sp. TT6]QQP92988.1 hypothetical protein IGS68_27825 [Skermanella sp. TT6]
MSQKVAQSLRQRRNAQLGADLIIPVLAAGFTLYYLISSSNLVWEARANGTVVGVVLLALIAIQVARVALRLRGGTGSLGFGDLARWTPAQGQRLALIGVLILFIAAIPWLGTTLGLFLVMLAAMWILGLRESVTLFAVAGGVAAAVFLVFVVMLGARFPPGPVERVLVPLLGGGI